ncbi:MULTISPECIES: fumarylacetoacetate hydrolase family protein [Ramlibacter]|uniref:Fumarylacetoacetate hydrolase family protein n=1 Tax=Ramlibacter pinisoli TaxID=2682844 RepID=A0A6N8J0E4_9BURK|nr:MULTISPECIES: fumarylacetoacetate hydrolase family protein [Ramlibacter]MBA2962772.1 fumarylacetoacetate hydrolase family protein [Ramlibacter sp. CGMCC 1.13660]MVQ32714.1 fumarylacetoacetate hydrolase family protein [Ramlibacter pinisoli]
MKLVTFDLPGGQRHIGALQPGEQQLVDFTASGSPAMRDMLALIDGGPAALQEARGLLAAAKVTLPLAGVTLQAPLPEPRQMRDFLCFEKHFRQARANSHLFGIPGERDPAKVEIPPVWYQEPIYYKCNRFSVVGTGADVIVPRYSKMIDYELEFAAITGKCGKNIAKDQARSHVFGYLIFNDVSARDQQRREMGGTLGPTKGKDFDTGNVLGPWLVTADEVADPYDLTMVARVNGEEWSRGNSGSMHHRFEDIIAHVSQDETLHPGEFLGSGTVGGGCGLELGRFLKHGDVVELEIQGLGMLRNRIVFQQ